MSASIKLDGRLTRDPELKFANSGTAIGKFSVATNERIKNKQTGNYENSDPTFWECVAFGELGENVAEYLEKGKAVFVEGTFKLEEWTDKEGNKRTTPTVIVRDISTNLRWAKPKGESSSRFDDQNPPF